MRGRPERFAALLALFVMAVPGVPRAAERERVAVEMEFGPVWQSRNDVGIPAETGTRFSLKELQGSGPAGFFRATVDWNSKGRHGLRLLAAPLSIEGAGVFSRPVDFAGGTFAAAVPTSSKYQFNSYRLTYRYLLHDGEKWKWNIGATAKVRDAKIELRQGGKVHWDSNVGVVPLLHVDGEYRMSPRWSLVFDLDGLAAPQGRAFDGSLKARYQLARNVDLAFGYRTLEGGADTTDVYSFGWLHYGVASLRLRF
jgi:hypothetical protein